jgi:predicted TIM-barrel fold metal-dependent hydrolase
VRFGTNYPMLTARQAMTGLDALGLAPDVLAAFLHDNAARVFGLG